MFLIPDMDRSALNFTYTVTICLLYDKNAAFFLLVNKFRKKIMLKIVKIIEISKKQYHYSFNFESRQIFVHIRI